MINKQTRDKMIVDAVRRSNLDNYQVEQRFFHDGSWHFAVFPKGMTAAEASPLFD
jgi:hypothetical protein